MVYCDYTAYQAAGGTMTEDEFGIWAGRASRLIDKLTYGRASAYAEALTTELADACAQIADILMNRAAADKNAASGLVSASNDGYSESYGNARESERAAARACQHVLEEALGADSYNLLYAGVV